ncbi:MAG: hypothetical protein P4L50_13285 [Anaerolineaceae bacterium]|nr:hypothetical protein [Anaerolineaceae bacterium]
MILFAAALLPLIFANRWVFNLDALLAGIGVGLFIDEVGKFITRTNNYFYPSAAPIIYAFFLITVLVYVRTRARRKKDPRAQLYYIFQDLEEVLDQDLSKEERNHIISILNQVIKEDSRPDLTKLAINLREFVENDLNYLAKEEISIWKRWLHRIRNLEKRHLNQRLYRILLIFGLLAWSLWTLSFPFNMLVRIGTPARMQIVLSQLANNQLVRNASGLNWFEARIGLQGTIGLVLLVAAVLFIFAKDRHAGSIAYTGLLFSLTIVSLLLFYFDQFATIIYAGIQLILLLSVIHYRRRFLGRSAR